MLSTCLLQIRLWVFFKESFKMSTNLSKREVASIDDLRQLVEDGYEIHESINHLSSANDQTTLLIIGSYIPYDLHYFFQRNTKMYRRIDASRNTNFERIRIDLDNEKNVDANVLALIEGLKEQRIAFMDLCGATLIQSNKSSDDCIKAFVFDETLSNYLDTHKNVKIIAISRCVEKILRKKYKEWNISYYHFFRGGQGCHTQDDDEKWVGLFNEYR